MLLEQDTQNDPKGTDLHYVLKDQHKNTQTIHDKTSVTTFLEAQAVAGKLPDAL